MATRKTVIRSEKRSHEVKLGPGEKIAQSTQLDAQSVDIPPPIARKTATSSPRSTARKAPATAAAPATSAPPARKKARLSNNSKSTPTTAKRKPAASKPKLPARVPADRLWEDDSAVMQRLQALQQQNARLTEQLQKLQHPAAQKGFQP